MADTLEAEIRRVFQETWTSEKGTEPPVLARDTVLLETGFDSLGFAIFVSNLEEALDYDPVSRTAMMGGARPARGPARIAVVTAGSSDRPVSREAERTAISSIPISSS